MAEEWVSVEERLPDKHVQVLVTLVWTGDLPEFHPSKVVPALRLRGEWRGFDHRLFWLCFRVTHWMQMPEPAATEGEL